MFGLKIPFLSWFTHENEFITKSVYSLRFMKVCAQSAINKWTGKALPLLAISSNADIHVTLQYLLIPFSSQVSLCFSIATSRRNNIFKSNCKTTGSTEVIKTMKANIKLRLSECKAYLLGKKSNQVTTNTMLYLRYWFPFWGMQLHFNLFYRYQNNNLIQNMYLDEQRLALVTWAQKQFQVVMTLVSQMID